MERAFLGISHTPLMGLNPVSPAVEQELKAAIAMAREQVHAFAPELVVLVAPDHYNGFFNELMPPFCIGTAAQGVGDYGTHTDGVYECRNLRQLEGFVEKLE